MNALSWFKHRPGTSRRNVAGKTHPSTRTRRRPDLERIEDRVLLAADPAQVCTDAIDLMVLVDSSGSVGQANFELEKQAVDQLVDSFSLGPQTAQIGIVEFSNTANLAIGLSPDASAVHAAVAGMSYVGSTTAMSDAVNAAQQELAAHGRHGVATPVMLLITDGQPTDAGGNATPEAAQQTLDAASAAKGAGTLIFAAGIGSGVNDAFLQQVVSPPSSEFYYKAPDFSGLTDLINQVATTTCTVVSTPPVVTSLQRFGFHSQQTQLVLTFSEDMQAATVQDVSNYSLMAMSAHHARSRMVRIVSAAYDTASRTATLTTSHPLPLRLQYQLTVNGSTPTGVASTDQVLLDGAGTGAAGSDYQAVFGREILAGPSQGHHRVGAVRTAPSNHAARGPITHVRHR